MANISARQLAQSFALKELDFHSSHGQLLLASISKAPEGCLVFSCYSDALVGLDSINGSIWKGAFEGAASVFKIFTVRSVGLIAATSGSCFRIGLVRVGMHQYTIGFKPMKEFCLFLLMSPSKGRQMCWASMSSRSILRWSSCKFSATDFDWLAFINVYVRQVQSSSQLQLYTFGKKGNMWEF